MNPIISLGHSSLAIIELTIIAVVAAVLLPGTLAASDYIHFSAASMGDPTGSASHASTSHPTAVLKLASTLQISQPAILRPVGPHLAVVAVA